MTCKHRLAGGAFAALALAALAAAPALAQQPRVLRIAMTAADVPTTTGMPNNGFEGMRFLGYPIFEPLVLWDLSRSDRPPACGPGWPSAGNRRPDPRIWIFFLRRGVTFHDGTPFTPTP